MLALALLFIVGIGRVAAQTVVWSDEFDGTSLDLTKWAYEVGSLQVNQEQEYYSRDNVALNGAGQLVITAKSQSITNNPAQGNFGYTSGRIFTRDLVSVKYGRVEARIQLPMAKGTWPAFWMKGVNNKAVGWPECGEIDIMEQINTDPTVHSSLHWSNSGSQKDWTSTIVTTPSSWHVYAVEWSSSSLDFYVDSNKFGSRAISSGDNSAPTFQKPFFILLNMAVGGIWPGNTTGSLNAQMLVDYVRVYSTSAVPSPSIGTNYAQLYSQTAAPIGQQLQIISSSNYFYVSSNGGGSGMSVDRSKPGSGETWTIVNVGNVNGTNYVSLQQGMYASMNDANGATPMIANRTSNGWWEWFQWEAPGNGFFSLKCFNGKYASVSPGFNQPGKIYCNATSVTKSEQFFYHY